MGLRRLGRPGGPSDRRGDPSDSVYAGGRPTNRGALTRRIAAARTATIGPEIMGVGGAWPGVVGYVSRFARDLRTAVNARHDLHEAGAVLLFADERLVSSDESAWENWARETVEAEAYSRRLARAVHNGYAAKIRDFIDQEGGLVPVGFRRVGDRKLIEPDPDTMPTATSVWELAAQGAADATISTATGLSLWTVRGILRSPLYAGRLHDGRSTRFRAPVDPRLIEQALGGWCQTRVLKA